MKIIFKFLFTLFIMVSLLSSNNPKYSSLSISVFKTDSLHIVAYNLTEAWLNSFIDTTQEAVALSDFKISKIGHPFFYDDSLSKVDQDSSKMSWNKLLSGSSMIISINVYEKAKERL